MVKKDDEQLMVSLIKEDNLKAFEELIIRYETRGMNLTTEHTEGEGIKNLLAH
jgi:hypothetical protein